jgi:radical SAM superfamily enzyme YgiQ (UPF0313 family)
MPPATHPLGILYLASYLRKYNYNVVIRDLNREEMDDSILDDLKSGKISIVGISMLSYARKSPYQIIDMVHDINPDVKIVVGGIHASSIPLLLVNNFPIDAAVIGEGEVTMKELADLWIHGSGQLEHINGIATRQFGIHKSRALIKNLDDIPFPDHSKVDYFQAVMARNNPDTVINNIRFGDTKFFNMIISRGCMGKCSFCNAHNHWGNKVRFRSASNVVDEMEHLYVHHNVTMFGFNDDSFGQNKRIAIDICQEIIKRGMKIIWYVATRVDVVDKELLLWMKRAGCFSIAYGIESGSETILYNIGKKVTKDSMYEAMRLTKEVGIWAYALMMVGNLGETDDTIGESVDFLRRVQPDIMSCAGMTMVFPGTMYYDVIKRRGECEDAYWLQYEDAAPTLYDNFTDQDLNKWMSMLSGAC